MLEWVWGWEIQGGVGWWGWAGGGIMLGARAAIHREGEGTQPPLLSTQTMATLRGQPIHYITLGKTEIQLGFIIRVR